MAKRKFSVKTVATPKPKVKPKRWQMFETVNRNTAGQVRLYDRARVVLYGRSAMSRVPAGVERGGGWGRSQYAYTGRGYLGSGPWRRKAR